MYVCMYEVRRKSAVNCLFSSLLANFSFDFRILATSRFYFQLKLVFSHALFCFRPEHITNLILLPPLFQQCQLKYLDPLLCFQLLDVPLVPPPFHVNACEVVGQISMVVLGALCAFQRSRLMSQSLSMSFTTIKSQSKQMIR